MPASEGLARRAGVGAALVAGRTIVAQLIAVGATVVLARHLTAEEFGVLAVGTAITMFAAAFADVGLAAGLIRGSHEPTRRELRCALGLQLVVFAAVGALAAAIVAQFGRVADVTDLMLIALPLMAWQTPARVVLERGLDYRRVAAVEVAQSLVYSGWAILAVIVGWGVWGVASATVAQAAAGSLLFAILLAEGRLVPQIGLREWRSLGRFGFQFQAITFTNLARDHGLSLAVGALLGLPALGLWNVAMRVMRLPLTLFGAIWRVSYPAMARVVRSEVEPAALLERSTAVASIACGALLVPLAGSALPTVAVLFGDQWREVGFTVAPACVALLVGGPISLATGGYLYAAGGVRSILAAAVLHTLAWFLAALPLLPWLGVPAVGIAWIAGSAVDAAVLGRSASARSGARLLPTVALPLVAGVLASATAFLAALQLATGILAICATAGGALVGYMLLVGGAIRLAGEHRFVAPFAELVPPLVSLFRSRFVRTPAAAFESTAHVAVGAEAVAEPEVVR